MAEYLVTEEQAKEFGLLDSENYDKRLNRIVIAFTVADIYDTEENYPEIDEEKMYKFQQWFYKNYQSFAECYN